MKSIAAKASVSLTPSSIMEARASRNIFSTGYSLLRPYPPKTWMASLATLKAHYVARTFAATAWGPEGVIVPAL